VIFPRVKMASMTSKTNLSLVQVIADSVGVPVDAAEQTAVALGVNPRGDASPDTGATILLALMASDDPTVAAQRAARLATLPMTHISLLGHPTPNGPTNLVFEGDELTRMTEHDDADATRARKSLLGAFTVWIERKRLGLEARTPDLICVLRSDIAPYATVIFQHALDQETISLYREPHHSPDDYTTASHELQTRAQVHGHVLDAIAAFLGPIELTVGDILPPLHENTALAATGVLQ